MCLASRAEKSMLSLTSTAIKGKGKSSKGKKPNLKGKGMLISEGHGMLKGSQVCIY